MSDKINKLLLELITEFKIDISQLVIEYSLLSDDVILEIAKFHKITTHGRNLRNGKYAFDFSQIRVLAEALSYLPETPSISKKKSPYSYGLKGLCEYGFLVSGYVSNGELMLAAILAGFNFKDIPETQNVWVNIHHSVIKKLCRLKNKNKYTKTCNKTFEINFDTLKQIGII